MKKLFSKIRHEKGSSYIVTVWAAVVLLMLGATSVYITDHQREQADRDGRKLNALNIAEAAISQKIEDMAAKGSTGSVPWTDSSLLGTTTGTVQSGLDAGTYTLATTTDTMGSAYRLLTATADYKGTSETVKVRIQGYPNIFNYAIASNGNLKLVADRGGPITITGKMHANGNLKLTSKKKGIYDLSQATITYTGSLNLVPADLDTGGTFAQRTVIDYPQLDVSYYRNQSNWPGQTVVNINLDDPPSSLDPYESGGDYYIPAADIDGLFGAGSIVNFYTPTTIRNIEVKIYNDNADPVTLTQTFTAEYFEAIEFEGNIVMLPVNGQAVIARDMKDVALMGGVQVGAIGQGALVYSYGVQSACGNIEMENNVTVYGSFIEHITVGENPKSQVNSGGTIHFDDAFIKQLAENQYEQFLTWGSFTIKKVHYEQ